MSSLQVRDLPVQIYEKLKKEAKAKHRSLAQQTIVTLAKGLEASPDPKSKRTSILETLTGKDSIKKLHDLSDPVALVREDRRR